MCRCCLHIFSKPHGNYRRIPVEMHDHLKPLSTSFLCHRTSINVSLGFILMWDPCPHGGSIESRIPCEFPQPANTILSNSVLGLIYTRSAQESPIHNPSKSEATKARTASLAVQTIGSSCMLKDVLMSTPCPIRASTRVSRS